MFTWMQFFSGHPGMQQMGRRSNLKQKLKKKVPAFMENLLGLVKEKSLQV